MNRYLRNINDGFIYDWNPILAANPKCEEVTELEAYPERFINQEVLEQAQKHEPIPLETAIPPEPDTTPPELSADAARRFGYRKGLTLGATTPLPHRLNPLG